MNIPLPDEFLKTAPSFFGSETQAALDALDSEPALSVHLNGAKSSAAALVPPQNAQRVAWCGQGFYLNSRPRFTFDPLLHAGAYYVEEPSSMFVEYAYRKVAESIRVDRALDLCAAPGGKSVMLRSVMQGGLLVANEPIAKRAAVLVENIAKWGHPDVIVTQNYPKDFEELSGFFDLIATDVPCSGEGMFRKDETARQEWSLTNVDKCAERQREILRDVWPALREGGYIIYSTCTFNPHEDEHNVEWICRELGAEPVALDVPEEWGIAGDTTGADLPVYHFFPHRARGEGFFLALLRKTSGTPAAGQRRRSSQNISPLKKCEYSQWLDAPDDYVCYMHGEGIAALHKMFADDYARLAQMLNIQSVGVQLCTAKNLKSKPQNPKQPKLKPQYMPSVALAMSAALRGDAFPVMELGYADAIAYLRGETVTPATGTPKGWVAVAYRGLKLGFANNVGNRMNNPFPAAWRIRSTYQPTESPELDF